MRWCLLLLLVGCWSTPRPVGSPHIELSCRGTQIEEARHGKHSARAELALTCRVRIARRDGRTARWWIDTNGTFTESGKRYPLRAKMHYDIAVGDTDASVCVRAAEP